VNIERKILFLIDTLGNGGAERQMALLIKHLPDSYERFLWSLSGGPYQEIIERSGCHVEICARSHRFDIVPFKRLWKKLRMLRPDLVHSWGWLTSAFAAPMCRILGIPFVDGTIRIGWVTPEHRLRSRVTLALANRVIANSKAGLTAWGMSEGKGVVIYNAIDPERIPAPNAIPGVSEGFTVAMAARMSPVKDFGSFIKSARILSNNGKDRSWKFLALGSGVLRDELMRDSSELIRCGILEFPEVGLEVMASLLKAQVGVLLTNPSRGQEGCSNSIMEYMVAGLPVICNDSGGNREVVINGTTGFIIKSGDTDALVTRLRWLRNHPRESAKMGRAGAQRILNEFSLEKMMRSMLSVYGEVLQ
jgi:glycosyltransferase involved in cell wall biosynthesis